MVIMDRATDEYILLIFQIPSVQTLTLQKLQAKMEGKGVLIRNHNQL